MGTYSDLTEAYDELFPESRERLEFCKSLVPAGGKVLDCGCATGTLAGELARAGRAAAAFDLDTELIERAMESAKASGILSGHNSLDFPRSGQVSFRVLDLLLLESAWPSGSFDSVFCFGNTLVHLSSEAEIAGFFKAANLLMTRGGNVAVQILNYERIMRLRPVSLPPLDSGRWHLERNYGFVETTHGTMIDFTFGLDDAVSGKHGSHTSRLLPIQADKLLEIMKASGFRDCGVSSGWNGQPLAPDSFMAVILGRKP